MHNDFLGYIHNVVFLLLCCGGILLRLEPFPVDALSDKESLSGHLEILHGHFLMLHKNVVLDVTSGCRVSLWARLLRAPEASHWQVMADHPLFVRHVPVPVAQ